MKNLAKRIACVLLPPIECLLMGIIGYYFHRKYLGEDINIGFYVFVAPIICILLQIFSWSHLWAFTNKNRKEGVWEVLTFLAAEITVFFIQYLIISLFATLVVEIGHTNPRITFLACLVLSIAAYIPQTYYRRGKKILQEEKGKSGH